MRVAVNFLSDVWRMLERRHMFSDVAWLQFMQGADMLSRHAACLGMQSSAGQLATEHFLRRTGALPSSNTHVAYTLSLTLHRCTPTALEPTCNASGRETPGWLCR